MPYRLFILPKAQREIKSLPASVQTKIRKAVNSLKEDPRRVGVKKLKGVDQLYRFRVDHYRIVYAIEDKLLVMLVVTVGHRKDVYQKLSEKYNPQVLLSIPREGQ